MSCGLSRRRGAGWRALAIALALSGVICAPADAQLQGQGSLFSTSPSTALTPPPPNAPGATPAPPGDGALPQVQSPLIMGPPAHQVVPVQPMPMVPAGKVALVLGARYGGDAAAAITDGLSWRVFATQADAAGKFRLVAESKEPSPTLVLPAGRYIVHVGFGLANAVKPVRLNAETVHETFDLPAGGLRLEGRVGNARIPSTQITFDVYRGSQFDTGERRPIAERVTTGRVVIVPEGTYYLVSNYGNANSVVRSDIQVQAGKLTDVTVTHRAAEITFKLVNDRGGEALANTQWSVLTPGGDVIKESIGAFPRVILAEGEYRAIARNEGRAYERDFKVINGVDGDIEVLTR